jgi:predicted TIM-barrel fold metal-dependent hydrolase
VTVDGAVDVHAHVLDPAAATVPGAAYAPFAAGPEAHLAHLDRLGMARGVLVTASVHGTDNGPLLAALAAAPDRLRGVAVVGVDVTDAELDRLHAHGVRAVRVQDLFPGGTPLRAVEVLGPRLAERGWHVEMWTDLAAHLGSGHLEDVPALVRACPVPVVLDHMAHLSSDRGPDDPALASAVALAREERAWITLSGACRLAPDRRPRDASAALAARVAHLLDAVPDRLLWGSDWPHVAAPHAPTPADLLAELDLWLPDPDLRRRVLVANPARCYGFAAAAAQSSPARAAARRERTRSSTAGASGTSSPGAPSRSSTSSTAVPSASCSAARDASWDCTAHRSTNTDTFDRSTHGSNGLLM